MASGNHHIAPSCHNVLVSVTIKQACIQTQVVRDYCFLGGRVMCRSPATPPPPPLPVGEMYLSADTRRRANAVPPLARRLVSAWSVTRPFHRSWRRPSPSPRCWLSASCIFRRCRCGRGLSWGCLCCSELGLSVSVSQWRCQRPPRTSQF